MAITVGQDQDHGNFAKIRNLPAPVSAGDAVNKTYVDSAVEGLAWKDSARVATTGNLNLASPGATIDGITMVTGDRVLVKSQTAGAENGVYSWNGAAVAATRALDANTAPELEQAVVTVEEGTSAGATFRQTAVNFTLDTTTVTWTNFGTSAPVASETVSGTAELATQAETDTGTDDARIVTPLKLATWANRKRKFTSNIGDGTATQYTVTHNFATRDVIVQVRRNASPWDYILVDMDLPDTNSARITFATGLAPTSNQFTVIVLG